MLSRSILSSTTRGSVRPVNGRLLARSQLTSGPVLKSHTGQDSRGVRIENPLPEPKPKYLSWDSWIWSVGLIGTGIASNYVVENYGPEWLKSRRYTPPTEQPISTARGLPIATLQLEESQIITMLANLQADSTDSVARTVRQIGSIKRPNPEDPGSVSQYLIEIMLTLYLGLFPTQVLDNATIPELLPLSSNIAWEPIIEAVEDAQDTKATELLRHAKAEILATRVSACMNIYNLLHSEEVTSGQKEPLDVVKAVIPHLQNARFTMSSKVFRPVAERLQRINDQQPPMAYRFRG